MLSSRSLAQREHATQKRHPDLNALRYAQVICLTLMCAAIALFTLALPAKYAQLTALQQAPDANEGTLSPANALSLTHLGFTLPAAALFLVGLQALFALVFIALALLIFWRSSAHWMGVLTALFLAVFGTVSFPDTVDALVASHLQWWWPIHLLKFCGAVCLGLFIFLFPNGRLAPGWMRYVVAVYTLQLIPFDFLPADAALNTSPLSTAVFIGLIAIGAFAQVYRYRRISSPVEREQTKWVMVGLVFTLISYIVTEALLNLTQPDVVIHAISPLAYYLTVLFIPITITIAILRSHLWDINILIRRTLVYGSLTATLALIYFGCVIGAQTLIHLLTGHSEQNPAVIVLTTLFVAALFQPVRQRLQQVIDRRFYRSKYDAKRTLAEFGRQLRTEVELDGLQAHLVSVVEKTMQPSHISLWLRTPPTRSR